MVSKLDGTKHFDACDFDIINKRVQKKLSKPDTNGCILWMGSKDIKGFGCLKYEKKIYKAHRIIYMIYKGDIPEKYCVKHKCNINLCVNPEHLILDKNRR